MEESGNGESKSIINMGPAVSNCTELTFFPLLILVMVIVFVVTGGKQSQLSGMEGKRKCKSQCYQWPAMLENGWRMQTACNNLHKCILLLYTATPAYNNLYRTLIPAYKTNKTIKQNNKIFF